MRLDKFVWVVRLYKTRSIATKACQAGKVKVNEVDAKPSKEVKLNDIISIRSNPIWQTYKVIAIPKSRIGPKLVAENIIETTSSEDLELLRTITEQNRQNRFAGQRGRPTKKDRRNIEKFI